MLRGAGDRPDNIPQVVFHLVQRDANFADLIAALYFEVLNRQIVAGDLLGHAQHRRDRCS